MFPALMNNLRASLPTSRVTAYVAVPVAASPIGYDHDADKGRNVVVLRAITL